MDKFLGKVLIIDFPCMTTGGVETSFAYLIRYAQERNYRVIWITTNGDLKNVAYKDTIDYSKIDIITLNKIQNYTLIPHKLLLDSSDDVVMLTPTMLKFIAYEQYRHKWQVHSFKHYLCVPHFKGRSYFPETAFKSRFLRKAFNKRIGRIVERIDGNDCLRGFSLKHLETYEKVYGLNIEDKGAKVLKTAKPIPVVEEGNYSEKAQSRKDKFVIATCSRFEFPHKGYLAGLVKAFNSIKQEYPNAVLKIIGYGDAESKLREIAAGFDETVSNDIVFLGKLSHADTLSVCKNAHLFVGLAGAASDAASVGTPTLIARHYSYDCEVCGWYTQCEGMTLSDESKGDVLPWIEQAINMSDDDYIELSKDTKRMSDKIKSEKYNPNYFFEQKEQPVCLPYRDIFFARLLSILIYLRTKIRGLLGLTVQDYDYTDDEN